MRRLLCDERYRIFSAEENVRAFMERPEERSSQQ